MEWCVAKTGIEMFDALHAYGLGILLANVSGLSVELRDDAMVYRVYGSVKMVSRTRPDDVLDRILALPNTDDLQVIEQSHMKIPISVATLDGLLAALFTTPGVRVVSVSDLLNKQHLKPSAVHDSLVKVATAIKRWKTYIEREVQSVSEWVADILRDYESTHPTIPTPVEVSKGRDISILMTIDPSFGYSTRRPVSDGLVTHKTNIAIHGTRYATLLAFIGAARFLRAQRVSGKLVNFYVPLANTLMLAPEVSLPMLYPTEHTPAHALVWQWLSFSHNMRTPKTSWNSLAYQTMQTQGTQQSIALDRGCLDCSWLISIERQVGQGVINFWRSLLDTRGNERPDERDCMLDCLKSHRMDAWLAHLRDVALQVHVLSNEQVRPYSLEEVRKITTMMGTATNIPLRKVLERKEGTLRFGHALRLLGQYNPATLRDLIEAMEAVQTLDQLIRVLARIAQECTMASAKSQFIIVPSDEDLMYLLDDVDHYGVRILAGLLMTLSALRYPRADDVDKYEAQTLIRLLLLLSTQTQTIAESSDDASTASSDAFVGPPTAFVPSPFEGEQ